MELPNEINIEVMKYLPIDDLIRLARVNKKAYDFFKFYYITIVDSDLYKFKQFFMQSALLKSNAFYYGYFNTLTKKYVIVIVEDVSISPFNQKPKKFIASGYMNNDYSLIGYWEIKDYKTKKISVIFIG